LLFAASMQAREGTIWVFLYVFSWLLFSPTGPAFAFDNRRTDSLHRELRSPQPDTNRIKTLLRLSSAYEPDSVAKSFYYANEALFLSEKNHWQAGIGGAELRMAICYVDVWELHEAIKYLHSSIRSAKTTGDKANERVCWQFLVHCYDHISEHQKAFDCQDTLLRMVMQTGDTFAICRQMSAFATTMFDNGRRQEGIEWLKKDLNIAEQHLHGKDRNDISTELLNTLADVYLKMNKTDSAFYCLRKGLPLAMAIRDTVGIAYLYSALCYAHIAFNRLDSAEHYAKQALTLAAYMKDLQLLKGTHSVLSEIYERQNRPSVALQHYKASDSIATVIKDSERTLEQSMQISRIAMEQQRVHREQERRDLESVNAGQRRALTIAIGTLIALAIIAGLIYRNLKNKEKTNRIIKAQADDLQQQNEVIDTALRDKEILLQEMHHRVKNNLQLINSLLELQIAQLKDQNSVDALMVTQQRIYSMAMVHSRLYHTSGDASVEVHEFAKDLFQSLAIAFSDTESDIRFTDNISVTHLPLNMLVPLGLVLNELITNSFKHAFKNSSSGTISLDMQKQNNSIILTYTDSGSGIAPAQLTDQSDTLGIYLIKRLTRQLKGEMVYNNETGSTFTITFPYERDQDRHSGR
jgi:two-component sensor histidine kinase